MRVLAGLFCAIGVLLCFNNWRTLRINMRNARTGGAGHVSMVPLVGPLALLIGLANLLPSASPWVLAVVLLDAWSWMLLLWAWQALVDRD